MERHAFHLWQMVDAAVDGDFKISSAELYLEILGPQLFIVTAQIELECEATHFGNRQIGPVQKERRSSPLTLEMNFCAGKIAKILIGNRTLGGDRSVTKTAIQL